VLPVEAYTPARKAEFLLNNAVDLEDYRRAVREVRGLGIEPDDVPHKRTHAANAPQKRAGSNSAHPGVFHSIRLYGMALRLGGSLQKHLRS
jgi:hypothetical protein